MMLGLLAVKRTRSLLSIIPGTCHHRLGFFYSTLRHTLINHAKKLTEEHHSILRLLEEEGNNNVGLVHETDREARFKRLSELEPIAKLSTEWNALNQQLEALYQIKHNKNEDREIQNMASEDISMLVEPSLKTVEEAMKKYFLPKDNDDDCSIILEVRAGTGGSEAAIFTLEMLNMYKKYADKKHWKFELMSLSAEDSVGKAIKDGVASISGLGVYGRMKYESGVHRVQRVPNTEASGRIHTSTMTIAVLPKPENIDFELDERDLRIDVYRSSGAGGQHVNTTNSAVRVTHIPTGLIVAIQDERSQLQNKIKAMAILKARLYQRKKDQAESQEQLKRKQLVGNATRSEKIRTYNYPQGRVTDHRINMTLHSLEDFMNGNIDELVDALVTEHEAQALLDFETSLPSHTTK